MYTFIHAKPNILFKLHGEETSSIKYAILKKDHAKQAKR